MRSNRVLVSVVLLLMCSGVASGSKKAVPPKAEQLVGVWTGWEADSMTFFRADLPADGTGYLASSFLQKPAVLSRITTWSIQGWRIQMKTEPIDVHPNDVMVITGEVVVRKLVLSVVGGKNEWRQSLVLHRDEDARQARTLVDERMKAVR